MLAVLRVVLMDVETMQWRQLKIRRGLSLRGHRDGAACQEPRLSYLSGGWGGKGSGGNFRGRFLKFSENTATGVPATSITGELKVLYFSGKNIVSLPLFQFSLPWENHLWPKPPPDYSNIISLFTNCLWAVLPLINMYYYDRSDCTCKRKTE